MNNEPENNYNLIALIGIISIGICIILFGKLKKNNDFRLDGNKNYRYKKFPSTKLTGVQIRVHGSLIQIMIFFNHYGGRTDIRRIPAESCLSF